MHAAVKGAYRKKSRHPVSESVTLQRPTGTLCFRVKPGPMRTSILETLGVLI